MTASALVPNKWRAGPPDTRSEGTMYHFVREHLRTKEGRCMRGDLLDAMHADTRMALRLSQSQGFDALLRNMVHSREIELEGDEVVASLKALRRRRII